MARPSPAATRWTMVCFSSAICDRLGRKPARSKSLIVRSWLCGRELRVGHDHRLSGQRLDRQPPAACQPVPRGHGHDGRFVEEHHQLDALVELLGRPDEGDVEPAGQDLGHQADGLVLDQLNGRRRVQLAKIAQESRHQPGRCGVDRPDADEAERPARVPARAPRRPVHRHGSPTLEHRPRTPRRPATASHCAWSGAAAACRARFRAGGCRG